MKRYFSALLAAGLTALAANAHFVFVVPAADGSAAKVVFSDSLEPDEGVAITKVGGLTLHVRGADGTVTPVGHKVAEHHLAATLPGTGPRVVFGSVNYGVMAKGGAKPYLLAYHPKAVVGDVSADNLIVGDKLPAELVPVREGGAVRLKLLAGGKPVPDAEVNLMTDGGDTRKKVQTDANGLTPAIDGKGRVGAWARYAEPKAGAVGEKKYDEIRHYATLVFDVAK